MIWRVSYYGIKKREGLWNFLKRHGIRADKCDFLEALSEAKKSFKKDGYYEPGEFLRFITFRMNKLIDKRLLIELEEKFKSKLSCLYYPSLNSETFALEVNE